MSTAKLRRLIQFLSIFAFYLLLILSIKSEENQLLYPHRLFFDLDPLILVTTYLSAHLLEPLLLLSIISLLVTAVFGRFYCGWFCPLGAIFTFTAWLGRKYRVIKKNARGGYSKLGNIKYFVLGAVVASALFGGQLVGYLDPIALLTRSSVVFVLPSFAWLVGSVFDYLARFDLGKVIHTAIGFVYLPYDNAEISNRFYDGGVLVGLVFLSFVLLNLYRERLFCRYLCPLGALFAILSKLSIVRVKAVQGCSACSLCSKKCPTGAEPETDETFRVEECVFCYDCIEACPDESLFISLNAKQFRPAHVPTDLYRRQFMFGAVMGTVSLPLTKSAWNPKRVSPNVIRPPGAYAEQQFLSMCIRCSACMRSCPTNVLQPAWLQGGLDGIWTPVMNYRRGYCQYGCTICSEVCPTGAIEKLPIKSKNKRKIGRAFFDRNRCIPYAFGRECTVCEEHCPTAPKAIYLQEVSVQQPDGTSSHIKVPSLEPERCIGCGICQYVCPIVDKPGIRVSSIGESRNDENRFLAE